MLNIVHGWLIDPQHEAATSIGPKTYNQLMERIIDLQSAIAAAEAGGGRGRWGARSWRGWWPRRRASRTSSLTRRAS